MFKSFFDFIKPNGLLKREVELCYQKPTSISKKLPWMEYQNGQKRCFLLDDGKSCAALFECEDVSSEAKTEIFLSQLQKGLQGLFQDVFPLYFSDEAPWIVQFYLQDDLSLHEYYETYVSYIQENIKNSQFTTEYLSLFEDHLKLLTRKEGAFIDYKVSGLPFKGKKRRIRAVIYRRVTKKTKKTKKLKTNSKLENQIEELNRVAQSFVTKLESIGVKVKRLTGQDFYAWMLPWFNPKPRQCLSAEKLREMAPYPDKDHLPFGYDFSQALFYSVPESNREEKVWYFDGLPHRYISIIGLNTLPETGHLSRERQFGNRYFSLFDQFPEGSIFVMNIAIQSQEEVKNKIQTIDRAARRGTSTESQMALEDCELARRGVENGNYIFPTSLGVYIRGNDLNDLYDKETQTMTLLTGNGFVPINKYHDLTALDTYLQYLPMCYHFQFDKHYLLRSRYLTGKQLSQLLPLYGRERGTGNPGLPFFNRAGEPLWVDPFNPEDKDNNSHLLMLGSTGSGKSALCIYLMIHVMATYFPRLVIVDAGNSFRLLGDFFKSVGLNVNRVEISLNTTVSLNPFAESEKMLQQVLTMENEKFLDELNNLSERFNGAVDESNRDYLGEMLIAAQLMITGGEIKEEQKMTRPDRLLVMNAIIAAAKSAQTNGYGQMIAEDLSFALKTMAQEIESDGKSSDNSKIIRLREMADGIDIFCKDPLSAQFFNRRGEPWPEADITILEMGLFKDEGYEAQRALAFMGAMHKTMSLAEKNQYEKRFTVFFGDEIHILTRNPLTALAITRCSKMSRKIGLWLWLATQNVGDFPDEAGKMLSMIEFWICLGMSEAELKEVERFKRITEEERLLFRSVRKSAGQYVEGILLCQRFKGLFRNILPKLILALAMTEKHEKAERQELMNTFNCTEIEAAKMLADRMMNQAA